MQPQSVGAPEQPGLASVPLHYNTGLPEVRPRTCKNTWLSLGLSEHVWSARTVSSLVPSRALPVLFPEALPIPAPTSTSSPQCPSEQGVEAHPPRKPVQPLFWLCISPGGAPHMALCSPAFLSHLSPYPGALARQMGASVYLWSQYPSQYLAHLTFLVECHSGHCPLLSIIT